MKLSSRAELAPIHDLSGLARQEQYTTTRSAQALGYITSIFLSLSAVPHKTLLFHALVLEIPLLSGKYILEFPVSC